MHNHPNVGKDLHCGYGMSLEQVFGKQNHQKPVFSKNTLMVHEGWDEGMEKFITSSINVTKTKLNKVWFKDAKQNILSGDVCCSLCCFCATISFKVISLERSQAEHQILTL